MGGGILLNPSPSYRTSTLPPSSYTSCSRSNQYLSSSTSSSEDVNTPPSSLNATPATCLSNSLPLPYASDEDHLLRRRSGSAPEYGSRRIRFAPLPDPRRAVLVTEQGEELPLPSVFDDDDSSSISCPNLRNFQTSSPSSSLLLGDGVVAPKEIPTITSGPSATSRVQAVRISASSPVSPVHPRTTESPTPSTATITQTPLCSGTSSARFAKRLLYPFRYKASGSRRSGSRDSSSSRDDAPPSWGLPLGHWSSVDEGSRTISMNEEPLSRTRSATATLQSKPKRMLNGRVYGARKHHQNSANVFSNIPDAEPEFVEWGYGGMGSVKAGGMWGKVQSDQKFFVGHSEGRGRSEGHRSGADDGDDGSGMGWVKRRREERERKKLEEQSAQEAASKTNPEAAPTLVSVPVAIPTTAHPPTIVSVAHDISTVTPVQKRLEDDEDSSDDGGDEEDDDGSSSTEQDDDDEDDQVRSLSSFTTPLRAEGIAGTTFYAGSRCRRGAHQSPSRLIHDFMDVTRTDTLYNYLIHPLVRHRSCPYLPRRYRCLILWPIPSTPGDR